MTSWMIPRAVVALVSAVALLSARPALAQDDPAAAETKPAPEAPLAPPAGEPPRPRAPATTEAATATAEDGAPIGRAAPPTESGRTPIGDSSIRAGLEVFAQYSYRNFYGPGSTHTWYHAFDVPRVHAAVEGSWERARGRVVLEATRSAAEGALVGVAGDSLVLRVREAYAAYRPIDVLDVSAGVIPTLTVPNLDGTWMLRAIAPSAIEANGLSSPADLGAKARFDEPHGYGWVATAAYNGDGYASRELNRGKSVEIATEIHPLARYEGARPLGVFGSYVNGSTGTYVARANRVTGGVVWQGARVRAGATITHGWGFAQLGTQRTLLGSVFARVEPVPRLLFGLRLDHVVRDAGGDPNDFLTTLMMAAGYRLALPVEAFLALTRSIPTTRAEAELPGSNSWELRTVGRVVF